MKTKLFFVSVVALTLSTLFATSCKTKQVVQPVVQVQAYTLKDTSCIMQFAYPATMCGIQDVAIYPQVSGRITAIKVIEGQYVNVDDILFEIDDVPYRAAYEQALASVEVAKAQLETARLTYQSKKNLFDRDIISDYQLKLAENSVTTSKAKLGQAEAGLRDAANNLSFTKVRTMGKGKVGQLPYKVGSLVSPSISEPLTYVSDNSSIYADFAVAENFQLELNITSNTQKIDDPKFKVLQNLKLITNLGTEYPYKGKIHSVSGLISAATGSLPVRSIFPNPDGTLLSGGSCKVVFSHMADSVFMIPRSAMKEVQNKMFVFVIKDSTSIEQIAVNAERYDSKLWRLRPNEDGKYPVKAGDMITMTTNRLKDGDKVQIIN